MNMNNTMTINKTIRVNADEEELFVSVSLVVRLFVIVPGLKRKISPEPLSLQVLLVIVKGPEYQR